MCVCGVGRTTWAGWSGGRGRGWRGGGGRGPRHPKTRRLRRRGRAGPCGRSCAGPPAFLRCRGESPVETNPAMPHMVSPRGAGWGMAAWFYVLMLTVGQMASRTGQIDRRGRTWGTRSWSGGEGGNEVLQGAAEAFDVLVEAPLLDAVRRLAWPMAAAVSGVRGRGGGRLRGQRRRRRGRCAVAAVVDEVGGAAYVVGDDDGAAAFMTSLTMRPQGSCREGRTKTVARSKKRGSSDWLRKPQKRMLARPVAAAWCSSAARCSPSPTMTR